MRVSFCLFSVGGAVEGVELDIYSLGEVMWQIVFLRQKHK